MSSSRRPGAKKAAKTTVAAGPAVVDPRFENGPLAVVDVDQDGVESAYCVGGLVLDVPAKSIPALVEWTLKEARLGQARLHRNGRDADSILVLTRPALERYGLPVALSEEERRARRLPAGRTRFWGSWSVPNGSSLSGGSGRGRGSSVRPKGRSATACSCASRPGTRWMSASGTTRTTRCCRRWLRRIWRGSWYVRVAGDDAARHDGRHGPGVDDGAAPAARPAVRAPAPPAAACLSVSSAVVFVQLRRVRVAQRAQGAGCLHHLDVERRPMGRG